MQFNHNIISIFRYCFGSCMNSTQEGDPPFRVRCLPNRRTIFIRIKRPQDNFFRKMSEFRTTRTTGTTNIWRHVRSNFMALGNYFKIVWFNRANRLLSKCTEVLIGLLHLDYRSRSGIWILNEKGVS